MDIDLETFAQLATAAGVFLGAFLAGLLQKKTSDRNRKVDKIESTKMPVIMDMLENLNKNVEDINETLKALYELQENSITDSRFVKNSGYRSNDLLENINNQVREITEKIEKKM
jgi:hypothetical protein